MSEAAAMADLNAFRAEVRAWLEENCPPGARDLPLTPENSVWGGRNPFFPSADQKLWFERMTARGWTVPEWPVAYGGGGLDKAQAGILAQELARIKAAPALQSLGIWMLGPALLQFGSEEQRQRFLPDIARGKIRWAQGYSEPGAGSDLASVRTRGEDRGDHFLVNGQKIWTTSGDKCDMIFALIRTEPDAPKHLGISFLLIDMDDPGVTTRPIRLISGDDHFTATFFDDVKVPLENVVGQRGRGWDVAKFLLGHERQMIGATMSSLGQPLQQIALESLGREGLAREPALRCAVAENLADNLILEIAIERMRDQAKARQGSAHMPSILKLFGTELAYRRAEIELSLGGIEQLDKDGLPAFRWLSAPASCIAGGSSEIQLNILAKRALGLPEQ